MTLVEPVFDSFAPHATGTEPVIATQDLGRAFRGRLVLRKVNIEVRESEIFGLLGPNGAGKTTLLRLVAGVLAPDSGGVKVGASVKLGYFAQQSLDLLDPAARSARQWRHRLPGRRLGLILSRKSI